jgi:hypothetical protein
VQQKALVSPEAGASIMVVLSKRCGSRLVGFGQMKMLLRNALAGILYHNRFRRFSSSHRGS